MEKVGIITYHFAVNVGAALQCVALFKEIESLGFQPYVIDYRPGYHAARYKAWRPSFFLAIKQYQFKRRTGSSSKKAFLSSIRKFLKTTMENRHYGMNKRKQTVFEEFLRQHVKMSGSYKRYLQLVKNPPKYEAYVTGSDQVWNKSLTDGLFDPAYFLRFGQPEVKRVAYAVSMGETDVSELPEECRNDIRSMRGVFLRESVDSEKLHDLMGLDVQCVRDPTFFLTKELWAEFETQIQLPESFCFIYTVLRSNAVKELVSEFAEQSEIQIIDGSTHRYLQPPRGNYRYDADCGPEAFLNYINRAEMVITNSFHGTALSIIYHKNFVVVLNEKRNERIVELLSALGLQDRMKRTWCVEDIKQLRSIDYNHIDQMIQSKRSIDEHLLVSALT